ncbi:OmpA family protein [Runella limosa]|uniref:OmpA family protein n=1 Tax=Runella limosa TaxID=370978 RepID=UPI000401306F|nr:OmpA family protein [Runella limosa]
MTSYLLSLLFCICSSGFNKPLVIQDKNTVKITGFCYDPASGFDLKVHIFALEGEKKISLGESRVTGRINKFQIQLPNSVEFLLFESEGYRTIKMPIRRIGSIEENFEFEMTVPMASQNSPTLPSENQLHWHFTFTDNKNVEFKVNNILVINRLIRNKHLYLIPMQPGKHLIQARSEEGRLLLNQEFVLESGLTLMDVRVNNAEVPLADKSRDVRTNKNSFDTRTLYFDQSNYDLKSEVKTVLDSIATFLIEEPQFKAQVTGYTDNVGDRNKNMILSEYRARAIGGYIIQKGISSERIKMAWRGDEGFNSNDESEENKKKNRKVIIQISAN